MESRRAPGEIQLAFSAFPDVSPLLLAARAKGRLQHALRVAGPRFEGFSRKVAVRTIGDNTTAASNSSQEIALVLQNNLAYMLGQKRIWDDGFYAGTFSEYDFGAIRAAVR